MNKKLISKVFTTTLIMFFVLTVYTIPTLKKNDNTLRTNLEIDDVADIPMTKIYLLNNNNYLIQTNVFIPNKEPQKRIEGIIKYLTIENNDLPAGLNAYIPKNTKILSIKIEEKTAKINFSKELLDTDKLETVITGIVYSIINIEGIDNLLLTIDDKPISNYEKMINKNIGINKDYSYTSRNNIMKTTIFYLDNINDNYYYVPVTKYLNDNREKIEVIVDELINNNSEFISPINNKTKLLNYKELNNVLYLNFNKYFIDSNNEINKNIQEMIAYSVFENYDVDMVMYEVNDKKIDFIKNNQ